MNKPIFILYGPPAIGKTVHAAVIAKALGCDRILDGDDLADANYIEPGALGITNDAEATGEYYELIFEMYRQPCVLINVPNSESLEAFVAALNRVAAAATCVACAKATTR